MESFFPCLLKVGTSVANEGESAGRESSLSAEVAGYFSVLLVIILLPDRCYMRLNKPCCGGL